MKPLGIGVVGRGMISRYLVAALSERTDARLIATCDVIPERLSDDRAKGIRTYTAVEDLLNDPTVDAIVVCTPAHTHGAIIRAALTAGKHVLCEKPLVHDIQEAEALVAHAVELGLVLFTAFHRRYNQHVHDLVAQCNGRVITHVTATYNEDIRTHSPFGGWVHDAEALGRGCILDNGINVFDVVYDILGPFTVTAATCTFAEGKQWEVDARIDVVSAKGVPCRIHLDWAFPGERKDVQVSFKDGATHHADMLAGFSNFKSSLSHEYAGICEDFVGRVRRGDAAPDIRSVDMLCAVAAAYACVRG